MCTFSLFSALHSRDSIVIHHILQGKNCLRHMNPCSPAVQCLVATVLSLQIVHVRHRPSLIGWRAVKETSFLNVETSNSMASLASRCMWTNKTDDRYTGVMHTKSGAGPCVSCNVLRAPNFAHRHHFLVSTRNLKPKLKPAT